MTARMITSAADIPALIDPQWAGFSGSELRVFSSVPEFHHDVAALLGLVFIYETDGLCRKGIEDGALYVVEDQRPVGGVSWETYDQFNRGHGPREPRVRITTSRRVVRAIRRQDHPDHWWQVLPSGFHDGPFPDWSMTHNMVGKIVGLYRPE